MAQCNVNMEITGMTIEQSVNTTPKVIVDAVTSNGGNITFTTDAVTTTMSNYDNYSNTISTVGSPYWNQGGILTIDTYSNAGWSSNLEDTINDIIKRNKEKENEKMTNEFDFGPYNGSDIRLSTYGIALKNKVGKFVSYDRATKRLMDVDVLNVPVETKKIFYKIPKALEDVREGDVIIHNGILVFVEYRMPDADRFTVIDPVAGTEYVALPLVSPFGYDYIVSIVSLVDSLPVADPKNPFGSLLPFLLSGKDNNGILMALAMGGDLSEIDPMVLMLMSGGDVSPFLIMQMMNKKKKKYSSEAEKIRKVLKDCRNTNKEDIYE